MKRGAMLTAVALLALPAPASAALTFAPGAAPPIVLPGDGSSVASVVAADLNGDGHADIAATTNGGGAIHVFVGDGTGGFTRRTMTASCRASGAPIAADVMGDSRAELVVVHRGCGDAPPELRVYSVNEVGEATLAQALGGTGLAYSGDSAGVRYSLSAGDLTGDGRTDVVATRDGRRLQVFRGSDAGLVPGASRVYADRGAPRDLGLGDVDGDGRLDAVMLVSTCGREGPAVCPGLVLLRGDGRGRLRAPTTNPYLVSEESYRLSPGDVNGDGRTDVVTPSLVEPGRIVVGGPRGFAYDGGDVRGGHAQVAKLGPGTVPAIVTVGWVGGQPVDRRAGVTIWQGQTARPGTARVSGRPGCVRGARVRVTVRGRDLRRVTATGLARGLFVPRGRDGVWRIDFAARRLARRGTTLRVTASFDALQPPRVFTLRLRRCR